MIVRQNASGSYVATKSAPRIAASGRVTIACKSELLLVEGTIETRRAGTFRDVLGCVPDPGEQGMSTASLAANASVPSPELRESRFFRRMAILLALTVIAGFGGWFLKGYSSFASPWWVHVHAISNMSWIALFVAQTSFIARGDHARHRALGKAGVLMAAWMLLVGLVLTPYDIAMHRFPAAYFSPAFFWRWTG